MGEVVNNPLDYQHVYIEHPIIPWYQIGDYVRSLSMDGFIIYAGEDLKYVIQEKYTLVGSLVHERYLKLVE